MTGAARVALAVAVWLVVVVSVGVLGAAVLVPRLGGATPYTVLTGSMRPHYPPGTLVVARPVPVDDLRVGDVVTYQLRSGEPTVVTHRVTAIGVAVDGETVLRTRGDANRADDPAPVRAVQVRGRLWYAVPGLGRVVNQLDVTERRAGTWAVAAGLAGYGAWMFASAGIERRRAGNRGEAAHETSGSGS